MHATTVRLRAIETMKGDWIAKHLSDGNPSFI